jgi:exopolysaccharide biosynthesis polyprenyl glycosylphosphotransferase
MKRLKTVHTACYIALDYLSAMAAWFTFFLYRKYFIEPDKFGYSIAFETGQNFYLGLFYVPLFWVLIYYLTGFYSDVWRKSRLKELHTTFSVTLLGVVILFFSLLLDDEVARYTDYYYTAIALFSLQYGATIVSRIAFVTYLKKQISLRKIGFNTIIAGDRENANKLYADIANELFPSGYLIKGYVGSNAQAALNDNIPYLGSYTQLPEIIHSCEIEEVIIAIDSSRHNEIIQVTNLLEGEPIVLKILPDTYDVVSGTVKLENVVGMALIEVKHEMMAKWQQVIKRTLDILVSASVLLLLSPLYLALAIAVKQSSIGPVFFKQIRIGKKGKPFHIYKFRSMYVNAEDAGPALSSRNDKRITPIGKVLRKYRFDEIPQFYNVLKGDMSLVGPRPERKYYIDQIVQIAPYYKQLLRVKPGITSWGMVKYGYAENVEQMVERLKFDILYIENMSLAVDFRIMIYTVLTILKGAGK